MGCRILHDTKDNIATFYCSTSCWTFPAPVFSDGDDSAGHFHDAEERAQAFLRWLDTTDTWFQYEREALVASGRRDPRQLTERGMERAYSDWQAQEAEQWAREEASAFAEE